MFEVSRTIEIKGEKTSKKTLSEKVKYTLEEFLFKGIIVRIERKEQMLNGSKIYKHPLDHFFMKSAEALNTLELLLNMDGTIKAIKNHSEILKNWELCRLYLDNYFISDQISSLVEDMDNKIKDEDKLTAALNKDIFLHFCFYGYNTDYGQNNILVRTTKLHNFIDIPLNIKETMYVEKNDDKKYIIALDGRLSNKNEEEAIQKCLQGGENEKNDISLKGKVLIDDVGVPEKINVEIETQPVDSGFYKKINLQINAIK